MPCLTLDLRIAGGELLVNLDGRHYSDVCESWPAISLLFLCLRRSVFPRVTSRVGLFKRSRPAYQATEKKEGSSLKCNQAETKLSQDRWGFTCQNDSTVLLDALFLPPKGFHVTLIESSVRDWEQPEGGESCPVFLLAIKNICSRGKKKNTGAAKAECLVDGP